MNDILMRIHCLGKNEFNLLCDPTQTCLVAELILLGDFVLPCITTQWNGLYDVVTLCEISKDNVLFQSAV